MGIRNKEQKKMILKKLKNIIKIKKGKHNIKKYPSSHAKIKVECKEGHIWNTSPNRLQRGDWCSICSEGISERICRKFFEEIFNEKFPKKRYDWLLSPKLQKLQLDGYNEKLKLAFEYQGEQHYSIGRFTQTKKILNYLIRCDQIKRDKCKEKGITLIEVPYTVKYEDMEKYILDKTKSKIPFRNLNYNDWDIYSNNQIKELQDIARSKGGKCLSKKYINAHTKLKWQCKKGHIWEAEPCSIKLLNTWCSKCNYKEAATNRIGKSRRHTLEEMQNFAKRNGGYCLSKEYTTALIKLKWQCKEGHIWISKPYNIIHGSWCPICANSKKGRYPKLTMKEMKHIVKLKGGFCLSKKYINSYTKLKWKCKEGHIWNAVPSSIKSGKWCMKCRKRRIHIK